MNTSPQPSENPLLRLLDGERLPEFGQMRAEHVEPAVDRVLQENREALASLLETAPDDLDPGAFLEAMETIEDRLDRVWAPVSHLNAVLSTPEWRTAHDACLGRLSAYYSELGQNQALYAAYRQLAGRADFKHLGQARKRSVEHALRDFRLSGVALEGDARERFRAISERLSALSSIFSNQVMDATDAWSLDLPDDSRRLDGIPESALQRFRQSAGQQGGSGFRLTLDAPAVLAVLNHASDRSLRETVYTAYGTRASDQGPDAGRFDNSAVMDEILDLRHEQAQLLGFANYAERSLATKMADNTDEVAGFLLDLAARARPKAEQELAELHAFAKAELGLESLQPWDLAYASERLRQARFNVSDEDLYPYFRVDRVIDGLFRVAERLFGLEIRQRHDIPTWHPDVTVFELRDQSLLGLVYLDVFARSRKRGGAWMAECRVRRRRGSVEHDAPIAFLTCNLAPPVDGKPSRLTHDEVITLFHEFGHGLHHLLTRVDCPPVAGIRGVPWDAVELPSQFLENWCWQREALDLFAVHEETGEPIPEALYRRLLAARTFQSGLQTLRQVEFSLFDLELHRDARPGQPDRVASTLASVRDRVAVVQPPGWHRFAHAFGHIFAGGYAAGYYSYKWAEVLSADAYSRFEEDGAFNAEAGRAFRQHILEKGGSDEILDLYVAFRGRPPTNQAFLKQAGLIQRSDAGLPA